ncbi:MAG: hypothetical protein P9M14_03955 [Candidatus Alcyoniella australis]|nr:hypothetical protein [Candidatus Alcyoniella australis]
MTHRAPTARPVRFPDRCLIVACLIAAAHAIVYFALLAAKWTTFDPALLDAASLAWMMGDMLDVSGISGYWWRGVVWMIQPLTFLWIVPLAIFNHPLPLLAHGPLWTALGGLFCFALGRRLSGSGLVGLACELLVLLNPYTALLCLAGVVPGAEGMALVPAMLLYRYSGRMRAFTVAAVLLAMCRIDFIPALLLWGVWMRWRERSRPFGRRAMLVGGVALAATLAFSALLLSPNAGMAWGDLHLGTGATFDPLFDVFSADNLRHLPLLLGLLFLPLIAPGLLVPTLVSLAMVLLTTSGALADRPRRELCFDPDSVVSLWITHYRVLLPFFSAAAVVGAIRLHKRMAARLGPRAAPLLAGSIIVLALAVHVMFTPAIFGPAPLTPQFNREAYAQTPRARLGWEFLAQVPEDDPALMSDTFYFRAWRHGKRQLLFSGQDELAFQNWALIDLYAPAIYLSRAELVQRTLLMLDPRYYGVVRFEDGYLLLRRGEERTRNAEVRRWIEDNRQRLLRARL